LLAFFGYGLHEVITKRRAADENHIRILRHSTKINDTEHNFE